MKKLLMICACLAMLVGCSKNYENRIIGVWEDVSPFGTQRHSFYGNGMYEFACEGVVCLIERMDGKYKVEGNKLKIDADVYLKYGGKERSVKEYDIIELEDNRMSYNMGKGADGKDVVVHLVRIK